MTDSYYCHNCYKAKVSPWGENLPYCISMQCREIENEKEQEYNRIKKIILDILHKEKIITLSE